MVSLSVHPPELASHEDRSDEPLQTIDEAQVIRGIQEYRAALESGSLQDHQWLLNKYPEVAQELAACLDALDFVHQVAPQLRDQAGGTSRDTSKSSPIQPLAVLGDFRIVREVGQGGMGIVYEATQLSLDRRVAFKVLPFAAMMDPKHLTRFKNEAQAAAALNHPNIVHIHSVGCERGVHFYVMQYVEGQSLAELIGQLRQLSEPGARNSEEEVDVVSQLARDLTTGRLGAEAPTPRFDDPTDPHPTASPPTTTDADETLPDVEAILSSTNGSTRSQEFFHSVTRLGIQAAEALEHAHQTGVVHRDIKPSNLLVDAQGHLWVTDFGLAMTPSDANLTMTGDVVGTLRYMSPEQASGQRTRLDYHTDLYSLGVTLYELLTLTPVYPQEDRQQLLRQILEMEPRPPRQLNDAIPKDLETIVLKATAKEPERRYSTAQALADDLRRFLDDKPIRAKRPAIAARMAKWARRHRTVVWSMVALLVALLIGSVVSTAMIWAEKQRTDEALKQADQNARRAEQNAKQAEQNAAESKAVVDFLVKDLIGAANPAQAKGRQVTVEDTLVRAEEKVATAFDDQPLVEASVRQAMGLVYFQLGRFTLAHRHLVRARELRARLLGPEHRDTLFSTNNLAELLAEQGELEDARKLHEETLEIQRRLRGPEHRDTLRSMNNLAGVLRYQGELKEARKLHEETLEIRRRLLGPEHLQTVTSMHNLANVLGAQGELEEARKLYEETLELRRRLLGPEHPATLRSMNCLAVVLDNQGDFEEARKLHEETLKLRRRLLGPEHPDTLGSINNLSRVFFHRGELEKAREMAEKILEIQHRVLGSEHPDTLRSMGNLAVALTDRGELEEARQLNEETLELKRRLLGPEHPDTLWSMHNLASVLTDQGELEEARKLNEETLEIRRRMLGPEHPDTLASLNNLGNVYREKGELDKAMADFNEVIRLDPKFGGAYYNRGIVYRKNGELDKALADFDESIRLNFRDAKAHYARGNIYAKKGAPEKAIAEYNEAIRLDPEYAWAYWGRSIVYREKGEVEKAMADCNEAIRLDPKDGGVYYNRGSVYKEKGELDKAIADFSQAIQRDPKHVGSYNARGIIYKEKGQYDEAIADYTEAIRLDSKLAPAYHNRGNVYLEKGELDKATADFNEAIRLAPKRALPYCGRSIVHKETGAFEKAMADCNEAIRLDPKFAWAYYERANVHVKRGELDNAIADLNQAIQFDRDEPAGYCGRATVRAKLGEIEDALSDVAKALELQARTPSDKNSLAWFLATCEEPQLRRVDQAIELANEVVTQAPNHAEIWTTLGAAQYRAGNWKAAREALQKSAQRGDYPNARTWFFLAMTYWQLGNHEEARDWNEQAVEWMEKNQPVDEELRRFRAEAAELLDRKERKRPF